MRLYTTLVRFDAAYHGHFKCNERKLTEFAAPVGLRPRPVRRRPGFGDTTDFDAHQGALLRHAPTINPTGIVPKGPDLSGWSVPHGRDQLA